MRGGTGVELCFPAREGLSLNFKSCPIPQLARIQAVTWGVELKKCSVHNISGRKYSNFSGYTGYFLGFILSMSVNLLAGGNLHLIFLSIMKYFISLRVILCI